MKPAKSGYKQANEAYMMRRKYGKLKNPTLNSSCKFDLAGAKPISTESSIQGNTDKKKKNLFGNKATNFSIFGNKNTDGNKSKAELKPNAISTSSKNYNVIMVRLMIIE